MAEKTKRLDSIMRPMTIPIDYAGRWIAMNRNRSQILASASHLDDLLVELGPHDSRQIVFYKVPLADRIRVDSV